MTTPTFATQSPLTRRQCLASLAALVVPAGPAMLAGAARADTAPVLDAPNVVPISPTLVSAGQPTAAALAGLGAAGFGAVIYLAPSTSSDAVPGEADIVRGQGLQFTHIPIPFNRPTAEDFTAFNQALAHAGPRKVLAHCQINMRASSMVFLHRVIVRREDPELAYQAVTRVWSPNGVWHDFIVATLRAHGKRFEPY